MFFTYQENIDDCGSRSYCERHGIDNHDFSYRRHHVSINDIYDDGNALSRRNSGQHVEYQLPALSLVVVYALFDGKTSRTYRIYLGQPSSMAIVFFTYLSTRIIKAEVGNSRSTSTVFMICTGRDLSMKEPATQIAANIFSTWVTRLVTEIPGNTGLTLGTISNLRPCSSTTIFPHLMMDPTDSFSTLTAIRVWLLTLNLQRWNI